MGDKGEKILQSDLPLNEKLSMRNRFLKVMHEFWAWIGQKLGIRDLTPEQISRLTFEQAVQGAVADITSGKAIRKAGENLENAEKNSIFAEQNNLNNDNRGKQYASNSVSRTFEEAKRELDTGTEIGRDKKTASREQQADRAAELLGNLERLAKVNGAWIETPEKIISFTPVSRGFENEVFESVDRNNVIKFNNLKLSEGNLDNFLDRIKAHNEFAPNTPYTILGIGKNSQGETTVILKQPHIKGKSAPIEKVMQFLKDNGFKPAKLSNGADGFRNDQYEISDLWKNDGSMMADNVLMDNEGNLYFIDADINRRINNGDYDLTSVADDINFQTEKPKAPNREDYTTVSEYLIALNGYNRQNRDANKARQARFNNAMLNGNYKAVQNFIEKNIDLKDKVKAVADFIKNTVSDTELNNSDWKYLLNRIQQARGSKTLESLLGEAYGRIIDSQIKQQLKNTETQLNIKMQEKAAGGNLKAKNTDNSTRLGLEELNRDRRLSSEEIEIRRKALEEELKEAEDNAGTVSEASLEAVNERFNGELQQFDNRTLKGDLHLGKPLGILQAAGINAKEITLSPIVLTAKLKQHGLTTKDLNGLSKAIQSPIMVYEWGTRAKSTIIVTELTTQDGRKITVAIKAERKGETLLVNDVASVHGKTAERFLSEMENAKEGGLKEALRYVEKEKALDWLGIAPPKGAAQAEGLNSIAKIIENFENPKIIEEDSHISGRKFAYADDIKARLDGLDMAEEYSEGIHGLQEKIKDTYEEMRNAFINNDMEFYSQLESSRNKDREELLTNTGKFNERLKDYIDSGKLKLKEWKAERKKIIENELHDGFIDLQNVKPVSTTEKEKKENKENRYFSITPKKLMKGLLHWGAEPIYSLEYMLRRIGGQKFIDGRGHLYNNIVPKWQAAEDTKQAGTKDINDRVKEKIKEIFGKDYDVTKAKDRSMKKMPDIKIEAKINGKPETIKLDAGKIMSIYAWNRQAEGAMKLRAMGIDHNKVNELAGLIDKRYIQFADWVTDELLPHTYEKYNRTHLKLFGTELPNIERYFPLVINPYSRQEKTDTSKSQDKNRPSVITGAIKTRTRNRYALDIDENFFDILNRHVNEMEDWNAYAALREDMNGLLSNTTFKNKLRALGDNFLDDFTKSVQTSLGQYHPNKNEKSEKIIQNLASNFAASKVSYNVWVAAKQILSSVLIMRYAAEPGFARYAVRNFTNIQGTIKWGLENLPSLERRWKSRNLGDENISRMGDNLNTKIVKLGMIPNAAMDLFASAAMARTVYDTSMEKYRSWGVKEDIAQREAKIEATVAFNTTQQSGESLYLSPLQVNKNWISKARTTFQNFNAGLQRITVASVKGLVKYYRTGKEQLIENEMRRLFSRFGLSGDRLRGIAEKEIKRQYYKNWGSILSVAAAIELYNMATYLWTDSDDKDNLLKETGLSALSTFTGGLSGMPILESTLRNVLTGNRWKESIASGIDPMLGDLEKFMNSPSEKNFIRTLITVTTSGLTGIDINRIAPIFEAAHIIADEGLASLDEVGVALLQLTGVPAGMIKDSKFTPRDDEMMITSKQGRDRGMIDNEIKETNKERVNRYMKRVTQIYNYLDTGVLGGYFSIQEKAKGITIPKMDRIIDTYSDYLFKRKEYKEDAEKIKKGLKEAAEAEREAMKTKIKIFDN
jgi:hypothetical protein